MELFFVRLVVPNPGMVIPVTVAEGRPRFFTACADTRSASVESSPPETPTTTHLLFVASMRLASAVTCIWKISRLRSLRLLDGTNGVMDSLAKSSAFSTSGFSHESLT